MRSDRFSLLAFARPRAPWLVALTGWANSGALEIELTRCISIDEVRARLGSLQQFSALLIDETCIGLDRDLLGLATDAGCASILITADAPRRDWSTLGADLSLEAGFDRDLLLSSLRSVALPVTVPEVRVLLPHQSQEPSAAPAPLLAVTGPGGTGTSTIALALAQSMPGCALVDAALDASLALLIGDVDVLPGLQELVEAHRTGTPSSDTIRASLHRCDRHGIEFLPGLRRHRDWTALRPRAIEATIDSIRRTYGLVIADIECDVEGESDTGSFDVADRNALSRTVAMAADLLVVTGRPDLTGLRRIVVTIADLLDLGVESDRLLPILMRPARSILSSGEIRASVARLLREIRPASEVPEASVIEPPRNLESLLLDGAVFPSSFLDRVRSAIPDRIAPRSIRSVEREPIAIEPGSLGIAS